AADRCRMSARHGALQASYRWMAAFPLCAGVPVAAAADDDADLDALIEAPAEPSDAAGPEPLPTIPLAHDQSAGQPPRRRPASRLVEEIVVTAQKREENLQDVPISIQACSADQLDAGGLMTVRDLALATPSLQFTELASYSLIYLRGVGTDMFVASADPSVATYIDGLYFPSSHSMAQSFGALERVEALKGPPGTLFGRNSTGGATSV